jgi:hypothetical protein
MPKSKQFRPESLTVAKWWADYLRDLAIVLKPAEMLAERDMVKGGDDALTNAWNVSNLRFIHRLVASLTPENIEAFERLIAEANDRQMDESPYDVATLDAWYGRNLTVIFADALQRAGIEPFRAVCVPVFEPSMSSIVSPGLVRIGDEAGLRELKITTS